MKAIYYLTFISLVIVLGWIFRPVEEHMTAGTCKRQVYGPQAVDFEKCARVYPEVYGPSGANIQNHIRKTSGSKIQTTANSAPPIYGSNTDTNDIESDTTPTSTSATYQDGGELPSATYEDDGEFRSDTSTRNAAYMNVFTFKPYAKTNFPVSGPPQPYLSNFAKFHS